MPLISPKGFAVFVKLCHGEQCSSVDEFVVPGGSFSVEIPSDPLGRHFDVVTKDVSRTPSLRRAQVRAEMTLSGATVEPITGSVQTLVREDARMTVQTDDPGKPIVLILRYKRSRS